mgnify:CR=1 FL=1
MIEGLFQRESVPVMDAALGMAMKRQQAIMNNIANVETPYYKRQTTPDTEFNQMLQEAIDNRRNSHPSRFVMDGSFNIDVTRRGTKAEPAPMDGEDFGTERHDQNNVVIEKEMADLSKNTLYIQTMQQLLKKKYVMLRTAARERVG